MHLKKNPRSPKKKQKESCAGRESNPGLVQVESLDYGKHQFYHQRDIFRTSSLIMKKPIIALYKEVCGSSLNFGIDYSEDGPLQSLSTSTHFFYFASE